MSIAVSFIRRKKLPTRSPRGAAVARALHAWWSSTTFGADEQHRRAHDVIYESLVAVQTPRRKDGQIPTRRRVRARARDGATRLADELLLDVGRAVGRAPRDARGARVQSVEAAPRARPDDAPLVRVVDRGRELREAQRVEDELPASCTPGRRRRSRTRASIDRARAQLSNSTTRTGARRMPRGATAFRLLAVCEWRPTTISAPPSRPRHVPRRPRRTLILSAASRHTTSTRQHATAAPQPRALQESTTCRPPCPRESRPPRDLAQRGLST